MLFLMRAPLWGIAAGPQPLCGGGPARRAPALVQLQLVGGDGSAIAHERA
jgi:hypothetical protein